jgi:hypothetical protein
MAKPGVEFSPAIRALVLVRDLNRCVVCGLFLGDGAHLHHRKLRSQGGMGLAENGITLCFQCHSAVHASPGHAVRSGWIVPSWADPLEVPVETWRGRMLLNADGTVAILPDGTEPGAMGPPAPY